MKQETIPFTGYQKIVIFILAITQFTVILDFMVMSPLGDVLMKSMNLKPSNFGIAVSAYAISAGISGLLTAGFADRFDRKKLLLFFYAGFIVGTIFCGLAHTYVELVAARIITGLFGGVIGSISMAIVTDIFKMQERGRVMSFVQMGFGASQVLGVPIGLYMAYKWNWEAPFWMISGVGIVIATIILIKLKPVTGHLAVQRDRSALKHLWHTITKKRHRIGFMSTALLSIGGFMMMPFGSTFAVNNLGVSKDQLTILMIVSGLSSIAIMPFIGRLSDKVSKFKIFAVASVWMMLMCVIYTNLSFVPFWIIIICNILMMMGVMNRMVPSSALTSAIPDLEERGSFMSVNASFQQMAGGIGAFVAGKIVIQKTKFSPIEHYDIVGYVIVVLSIISIFLMYRVSKLAAGKAAKNDIAEEIVLAEGI